MEDLQQILTLVDSVTSIALLLWLIVQERTERRELAREYREDLRDFAGIRHSRITAPTE